MARWEWTPEQEATLREHHAKGHSQTLTATIIGCTQPDISRKARTLGLLWNNGKTAAANQAQRDLSAQARAQLADAVLADAIALRERIWDQYTVIVSTPVGPQTEVLDLPDAKAVAEFTNAVERLIKTHENLTRMGAGKSTDHAKSMLVQMQEALLKAVEAEEET